MTNKEIDNLIRKAERSIEAAKKLYKEGFFDFSVSREYYAMFYCASALLLTKSLSFSKHSGVISAFGKYFVKSGLFSPEFHSYIINAFKDRQIVDYESESVISKEQAETHIKNAEEFLTQSLKYLEDLK